MTSATVTFCNLHQDILTLVFDAIDDGYMYNERFARPSVKALSETCKDLRAAAAPIVFRTLAIWDWDTFVDTAQAMSQSDLVRRYTRTLRVTPVLVRPLNSTSQYPGSEATRYDPHLPTAGGRVRTNSSLYYSERKQDAPDPTTAYMPLSKIKGGTQAVVTSEAEALGDLLLGFDNLTELIFGLGSDMAHRPPFEEAIRHVLGETRLPTVRLLNIEDTALFWTGICPQAHDLTVRLGYSSGVPEWPSAPAARKLTLHHTRFCIPTNNHFRSGISVAEGMAGNHGPAMTEAMPYITTLGIADIGRDFEAILSSLIGFTQLEDLYVNSNLSRLNVGLQPPSFRCGTGEAERWEAMSEEERAAEIEQDKRELEIENETKRRALNNLKRIILKHFPRLGRFKLGEKVCYDFSVLGAKRGQHETDQLQPSPAIDMRDVW